MHNEPTSITAQEKSFEKSVRATLGPGYKENRRFVPDLSAVTIIEPLGTGANGIVYKAIWNDKTVAVKSLCLPGETMDANNYSKFIKEGKLMLGLESHTHLIELFALCYSHKGPAIIMEYAPNGTLKSYLDERDQIHLNLMYNLVIGIAKGLRHLHKQDVIHRDIAARNILLKEDMTPMVSDFGLSRAIVTTDDTYASTGQDFLPLKWMAPEAIKNHQYSTLTDIWSFGIVIWEIITCGETPHAGTDSVEATIQIRDNFLTPPVPPDTDPTLAVLMKQCWYKDPDMRPTAKDIVDIVNERDE